MWVLRAKPGSSSKTASAINHKPSLHPPPQKCTVEFYILSITYTSSSKKQWVETRDHKFFFGPFLE